MEEKFNLEKVKVLHSKEGTVFEIITVVILFVSVVMGLINHHYTIRDALILPLVSLVPLFGSYMPNRINILGVRLKNTQQVGLAVRMSRIIALGLALLSLLLAILGPDNFMVKPLSIGIVIIIGLIGFLFIYLIQKAE